MVIPVDLPDRRPIRLVVCDLDGTLLDDQGRIASGNLDALQACRDRGILLALATARSETGARRYIEAVQPDWMISSGGALVRPGSQVLADLGAGDQDPPGLPVGAIHRRCLPAGVVQDLVTRLAGRVQAINAESDSGFYSDVDFTGHPDYGHYIPHDFTRPWTEECYKLTVSCQDRGALMAVLKEFPQCHVLGFRGEEWYRIAAQGAEKHHGLVALAEVLAIDLAQVCAFGDDINDRQMLGISGWGCAMGNAIAEVREVAPFSCPDNDAGGVGIFLRAYLSGIPDRG